VLLVLLRALLVLLVLLPCGSARPPTSVWLRRLRWVGGSGPGTAPGLRVRRASRCRP
jgi:hypothetical protein